MNKNSDIYAFAFRGILAEEALDKTARLTHVGLSSIALNQEVLKRLPIESLDESLVARAQRMATVYLAIAAFENSVREFVSKRLLDAKQEQWWDNSVPESVQKKAKIRQEEEKKFRWHGSRGTSQINYIDFGELFSIINLNWAEFEHHLGKLEWAKQIFDTLEKSRNVIMHSGDLALEDIERIGTAIRDWVRQVGA